MMIQHEPFKYLDPKLKSSLYDELEVQEIYWNEDDCTTDRGCDTAKRKPQPNKSKADKQRDRAVILDIRNCLENKIDILSDEILLKIFSHLDRYSVMRCSQVCHRWMNIGYDSSLWKTVELHNKNLQGFIDLGSILKHGVLYLTMAHCQVLGSMWMPPDQSQKKQVSNKKSKSLQPSCLQKYRRNDIPLQYLDVSVCLFAENSLLSILKKCKSLRFLSLKGTTLSDDLMSAIGENSNLREINLALCDGITSFGISKLTNGCKDLVSINLSWMALSTEILLEVACSFPCLEEVDLSGNKQGMDDKVVQTMVETCPNLKVIDLSDCSMVGNNTIDLVLTNTKVKRISLSRCHNITASKICELASMGTLEHLEMFGFTNQATLEKIKTAKPSLSINSNIFSPIAKTSTNRKTV